MDDLTTKLETHFSMVSSVSIYTVLGVGWYADSGASRHMTYEEKVFNRFQEQEQGMVVELGNDAMYPMTGLSSISFQMPLGDVLKSHYVLYVPNLTKCLLSFYCMTDLQCLAEFEGQQVTIRDSHHGSSQVLAKDV